MGEGPQKQQISAGLLAHVDAGKTTLSEALLYVSGARRTLGRVDHRDAYLDTHNLERSRGITIFSKQAILETPNRDVTLVDTPGHVDFSAEAERVLGILDCAVLVISGTDGVQAHTLTLWRLLERYQIPTFLFINKMDLPGTDKGKLLTQLQQQLSSGCVDFCANDEEIA
jgi:small GTP-binding protein